MGILSARNLTQALSQARNVGLVEEPFVVGDVSVVVRNLRPEQYDSIFKECQGLSDVEYLNAWQMGHVCRAICEMNGIDLRDTPFVEDEEPDPKRLGQMKTVRLETYAWLRGNILSTWSREIMYICYRKVADAIEAAEKKAQEGISFRVADESAEDKFRRLLGEMKEIEGEVPERILDAVLKDNGLMRRASMEEIEAVEAKLAKVAEKITPQPPTAEPVPSAPVPSPTPAPAAPPTAEEPLAAAQAAAGPPSPERMAQLLRNRVPMNQQSEASQPVPASASEPPPQVFVTPTPNQPSVPVHAVPQSSLGGRTAELAALENSLPGLPPDAPAPLNLQPQGTIPEIRLGSNLKVDPAAAQAILDTPPVGGINPRFRPPTQ